MSVAETARFSSAIEDYAKAIYALEVGGQGTVTTNALAARLGVTPGSASAMVKKLAARGLVRHVPYRGVQLTRRGTEVALEVLRHHRLLELFLAEMLDVPWDRVHEEAEVLEHVLSEELEERIADKLGEPASDPHGDPIPSRELEIEEREAPSLQSLEPGATGTLVRVSDSDPAMLRYLSDRGIGLGGRFAVEAKQPFGGPVSVRFGPELHTLGGELTRAMRVELDPEERAR